MLFWRVNNLNPAKGFEHVKRYAGLAAGKPRSCSDVIRERKREWKREKENGNERKRERERERGRGVGRGRGKGKGRERERERERKRERERERTGCFCKRRFFLFLAPGSALDKFAAIVNPENKPTKVNWTLSWPSALEICGKLFFNKGLLISDLILLGTADKQTLFFKKHGLPRFLATIANLPNNAWVQNNLFFLAQ